MRPITVRYAGDCQKCGEALPVGAQAIYEKRAGLWCPGCAPTDTEEIRAIRQAAADRKADRIEEWAAARDRKATQLHNATPDSIRHDWAFITQPGHIPERARMNRRDEKAAEHWRKAREHEARANSLRSGVRVAGDAEARRERERELTRKWIKKGMRVSCSMWGEGTVKGVYAKSARCQWDRGCTYSVDLSWLAPLDREVLKAAFAPVEA